MDERFDRKREVCLRNAARQPEKIGLDERHTGLQRGAARSLSRACRLHTAQRGARRANVRPRGEKGEARSDSATQVENVRGIASTRERLELEQDELVDVTKRLGSRFNAPTPHSAMNRSAALPEPLEAARVHLIVGADVMSTTAMAASFERGSSRLRWLGRPPDVRSRVSHSASALRSAR